mmetsp:Transcript_26840/g.29263  ORF Transcript_26840/g.29263 Transcript_26840/m.29263 type:complete len:86 (+) Transcript_26840:106-363(+)
MIETTTPTIFAILASASSVVDKPCCTSSEKDLFCAFADLSPKAVSAQALVHAKKGLRLTTDRVMPTIAAMKAEAKDIPTCTGFGC